MLQQVSLDDGDTPTPPAERISAAVLSAAKVGAQVALLGNYLALAGGPQP